MFRIILLCLLTCCSSFMPLKQSESIVSEDHTQVVEKKIRKNYVRTSSGYYEYGFSDLFSYDFLVGLVDMYVNQYNISDLSFSSSNSVANYVIQTSNTYQVFYYDETTMSYESIFNVSNIVIRKEVRNEGEYSPMWYYWTLGNASPYDKQIIIRWFAQRSYDNRLTIWGIELNTSNAINNIHPETHWLARTMISENGSSSTAFIYPIFESIKGNPYNAGYNDGYDAGYSVGFNAGDEAGYDTGYSVGQTNGYTTGYNTGVSDTIASGSEAMTIFAGIMDVAFIPVNVFFLMFDYEVFGINIAGFVSGLLTIAIVIILMRFIFGRKI